MMIGYIIPQIKNISNITIIGIEVDYNFDDEYIKLTKMIFSLNSRISLDLS